MYPQISILVKKKTFSYKSHEYIYSEYIFVFSLPTYIPYSIWKEISDKDGYLQITILI